MQGNELDLLKDCLKKHGVEGGPAGASGYFRGSRSAIWDYCEAYL